MSLLFVFTEHCNGFNNGFYIVGQNMFLPPPIYQYSQTSNLHTLGIFIALLVKTSENASMINSEKRPGLRDMVQLK